eukprot:9604-Heterococcus_DN1.PRE.16
MTSRSRRPYGGAPYEAGMCYCCSFRRCGSSTPAPFCICYCCAAAFVVTVAVPTAVVVADAEVERHPCMKKEFCDALPYCEDAATRRTRLKKVASDGEASQKYNLERLKMLCAMAHCH